MLYARNYQNHPHLLEQVASQLFFVVGMGRSGTALLRRMLSCHPDVSILDETSFYTLVKPAGARLFALESAEELARAVDHTLAQRQLADMEFDRQALHRLVANGDPSWDTIFLALLALKADQDGSLRVGEKTPGHVRHMGELHASFPRARFVHLIRDPRAVALSWLGVPFGSPSIAPRIRNWARTVDLHHRWSERLGPERYLLLRYENLVSAPEAAMRKVCRFLEVGFSTRMLSPERYGERTHRDRLPHMASSLEPVFTSSVGKWKSCLSNRQVGLIEQSLAREMELMGYPPSGANTRLLPLQIGAGTAVDCSWRALRWAQRRLT